MNPLAQLHQPGQPPAPPNPGNALPASDPAIEKTEDVSNIPVRQAPDTKAASADSNITSDTKDSSQPQVKPTENNPDKNPKDPHHKATDEIQKPKKPRGPVIIIALAVIITIALAVVAYSVFKKAN